MFFTFNFLFASFNKFRIIFFLFLESSSLINGNSTWKQHGIIVAGGNDAGNQLNQLSSPHRIYVDDDDQSIYIADWKNHRIVQWKYDSKNGEVVAGGNESGNRMDQLDQPTDVIVDKKNNSLIIWDGGNKRVIRWFLQNNQNQQIIISYIRCCGIIMDNNGDLYASDWEKNEVRRWKIGDKNGTIVAGGNVRGNNLKQLNSPGNIFVDQDYSVYVSDRDNHRVMKWIKGTKEGTVVAGGQDRGNSLTQLSLPEGVIVDDLGNVYVADCLNHRIMRWLKGSKEGTVIVGGNGKGEQSNQLCCPAGLSFDREGNLYVVDRWNHRVSKFVLN